MSVKVTAKDMLLTIDWGTGKGSELHFVWLRDNCSCSSCIHPSSLQKLHSSADIPLDIKPKGDITVGDTSVKITWTDGHSSEYPFQWLKKHTYHDSSQKEWNESRKPTFWKNTDICDKHFVSYQSFMENNEAFLATLRTFLDYGIVFITNVPNEKESVEKVATRIGPIRETFFGRSWDVINIPNAHNIAYTSVNLGLHQDLPYFESVPPVQMLHCMVASKDGGESVFADSYLAAERLKQKSPEHFETLLRVPMTMQYTNSGHNFVCQKTILYRNENLYIGVNFSPQNHGPMSVAPNDVIPFYTAYKKLSDEIYDDEIIYSRRLDDGDLVIFDNRRVLHGRKPFNPAEPRHLRGTYMGMDEIEDRYNTLKNSING